MIFRSHAVGNKIDCFPKLCCSQIEKKNKYSFCALIASNLHRKIVALN